MLSIKKVFDGEASARLATGDVLKSLTKELMRDDISIESKLYFFINSDETSSSNENQIQRVY